METSYILISCGTLVVSSLSIAGGYVLGGKKKVDKDECSTDMSEIVNAIKEIRREDRETHERLFDKLENVNEKVSGIHGALRAQGLIG